MKKYGKVTVLAVVATDRGGLALILPTAPHLAEIYGGGFPFWVRASRVSKKLAAYPPAKARAAAV